MAPPIGAAVKKCSQPTAPKWARIAPEGAAISDHFGTVYDMRVAIAPVNGCFTSGLTTLLDVLQTAEGLRRSLNAEIPSIEVEIGGFSDTVVTRNGLTAAVNRRLDRDGCADLDVLVVPSLGAGASAEALEVALGREDIHRFTDVLREAPLPAGRGRRLQRHLRAGPGGPPRRPRGHDELVPHRHVPAQVPACRPRHVQDGRPQRPVHHRRRRLRPHRPRRSRS